MKKIVSLALALLLLLLPGCTAGRGASDGKSSKNIFSLHTNKQKCPSRICSDEVEWFSLDWQENSVCISADEEVDAIDRAEFTPETNTLRFYMKQSDVRYIDYRFDEKNRVCEAVAYTQEWMCMQTSLLYNDAGNTVYGGKVSYYSDGEVDENNEFTIMLCSADNGYVVSAPERDLALAFTEWGDWNMGDDYTMSYDNSGNLLGVYWEERQKFSIEFSDTDRNYWRNMVLSMLQSIFCGAGGDGYIGSIPIIFQLGYQTAMMNVADNLYSPSQLPQETQPFPYRELYSQILSGENLEEVLDNCDD